MDCVGARECGFAAERTPGRPGPAVLSSRSHLFWGYGSRISRHRAWSGWANRWPASAPSTDREHLLMRLDLRW